MISHLGLSKNRGTPKSSILIGFPIINHPFWGTPIFGNAHIMKRSTCSTSFSSPATHRLRNLLVAQLNQSYHDMFADMTLDSNRFDGRQTGKPVGWQHPTGYIHTTERPEKKMPVLLFRVYYSGMIPPTHLRGDDFHKPWSIRISFLNNLFPHSTELKSQETFLVDLGLLINCDISVSFNGGTPKPPQNDHF